VLNSGDGASGIVEAEEQAFVQKLVTHSAIEGFDVAVLHGLARRNVVAIRRGDPSTRQGLHSM
jgi:hypothetical protein